MRATSSLSRRIANLLSQANCYVRQRVRFLQLGCTPDARRSYVAPMLTDSPSAREPCSPQMEQEIFRAPWMKTTADSSPAATFLLPHTRSARAVGSPQRLDRDAKPLSKSQCTLPEMGPFMLLTSTATRLSLVQLTSRQEAHLEVIPLTELTHSTLLEPTCPAD